MTYLKNCPNCGGYLNDNGRCEFCGSKIYDFVNVDFDKNTKTYIRVKYKGKIVLMPVVFRNYSYNIMCNPIDVCSDYGRGYFIQRPEIEGTLDFYVVGDVVYEKDGEE